MITENLIMTDNTTVEKDSVRFEIAYRNMCDVKFREGQEPEVSITQYGCFTENGWSYKIVKVDGSALSEGERKTLIDFAKAQMENKGGNYYEANERIA